VREYRFAGIEPCDQGDHGWVALTAERGKGAVRIPLSASDARELLPADPRLRTPAELLADGLRNTLRLFGEEPGAIRIEMRRTGDRQVIAARLRCAGGAEIPIACTAALLIGVRWNLRFEVHGAAAMQHTAAAEDADDDASEAPASDPLAAFRPAISGIDLSGFRRFNRRDPDLPELSQR
jgi:hypothetical protein